MNTMNARKAVPTSQSSIRASRFLEAETGTFLHLNPAVPLKGIPVVVLHPSICLSDMASSDRPC